MKDSDEYQHKLFLYQFTRLPDIQCYENFKSSDSTLFRFIETLAQGSIISTVFPFLFHFLRIIQRIAIISLVSMQDFEDEGNTISYYHQFMRLFVPAANVYGVAAVIALSTISVFCYIFGYIMTKKCYVFNNYFMFFMYIFAGEMPSILVEIIGSQVITAAFSIAYGKSASYVPFFIILLIFLIILMYISSIIECTLFNSLFYSGGKYVYCTKMVRSGFLFLLIIFIVSFTHNTFPFKYAHITYSILLLWYALHFLIIGSKIYHINDSTYNGMFAYGFTFLIAGINAIILAAGGSVNEATFISVYPLIFIVVYFFYWMFYKIKTKKTADKLQNVCSDFSQLGLKKINDVIFTYRSGFAYGIPSVINGKFAEWCLNNYNIDDLFLVVTRYASLSAVPSFAVRFMNENLFDKCKTKEELFVLWEYVLMTDLKTVTELPKSIMPSLSEAIRRCGTIPEIETSVTKNFSSDMNSNFLLLGYLQLIREQLKLYVNNAKLRFPNSLLVLRLACLFELNISKNKSLSDIIKKQIRQLENDNTQFVDIKFMTPLTGLPEAQKVIFEHNDNRKSISDDTETDGSLTGPSFQSSSDSTDDSSLRLSLPIYRKIHRHSIITSLLIILLFATLLVIVLADHFNIYEYIRDEEKINLVLDAFFNSSIAFLRGGIGSIFTLNGDGDVATSEFMLEMHRQFSSQRDVFAEIQNRYVENDGDVFELFIEETTVPIIMPTYNENYTIKSTLSSAQIEYLDQISIIIDSLGENEEADPAWIRYIALMQYYMIIEGTPSIGDRYSSALVHFMERTSKYTVDAIIFSHIPFMVVCVLIIVYLIQKLTVVRQLTKSVPKDNKIKINIMSNLNKNYPSLCKTITWILLAFLATIIVVVFMALSVIYMLYDNKNAYKSYLSNDGADVRSFFNLYGAVAAFQISYYSSKLTGSLAITDITDENLTILVERCISYFMMGNKSNSVNLERTTANIFSLVTEMINNVDTNYVIQNDLLDLDKIKALRTHFIDVAVPEKLTFTKQNLNDKIDFIDSEKAYFSTVIIIFYIVLFILAIADSFVLFSFKRTFDVLFHLAPIIDEEFKTKFVTDDSQGNELTSHAELIDYVEQPCLITTKDGIIISANKSWLNQYGSLKHSYVGKSYKPFLTQDESDKLIERSITDDLVLVVINVLPEEQAQKNLLDQLRSKMISYRRELGLERFAMMQEGSYSIRFAALVSIYWFSDAYSDFISTGKYELQDYIKTVLVPFIDYDLLNSSGRQSVIVFGVNEVLEPPNIVAQAITFALSLIIKSEVDKKPDSCFPQIAISCGDITCTMSEEKLARIELTGSSISKLMPLISQTIPGNLTICKETMEILQEMKFTPRPDEVFIQINPDMYQFTLTDAVQETLYG